MLLAAPLAILWIGGVLLALADGRRRWVGLAGLVILGAGLVATVALAGEILREGPVEMTAGNWPSGVGITFRADALGIAFAVTSTAVLFVAYAFEFAGGIDSRTFPALTLLLATGLTGVFITGDAFNFYVFFEISMVSAYILTAYGDERRQLRAAVIFAVVNLLGSVLFLVGIVSLYHVTGSLDIQSIGRRMLLVEANASIMAATLIFVAMSVKLGLFPFHFWLPAVYSSVHPSVAAMLSGALATIGSYGLLRFGSGMLAPEVAAAAPALALLGVGSIIYGGIQAVSRHDPAMVIAYSAIGQVGYILIAVAIGGRTGLAAAIIFTILNAVNKTLLFLAGSLVNRFAGIAFAIGAFSVAGVPPAAGFWGKLAMLRSSVVAEWQYARAVLTAVIVVGGILSILYLFQAYGRTFWQVTATLEGGVMARTGIVIALAILTILVGIWPDPLLALSNSAASVLLGGDL